MFKHWHIEIRAIDENDNYVKRIDGTYVWRSTVDAITIALNGETGVRDTTFVVECEEDCPNTFCRTPEYHEQIHDEDS